MEACILYTMPKRKISIPSRAKYAMNKRMRRSTTASKALSIAKRTAKIVRKTIERKQCNFNSAAAVSSSGLAVSPFINLTQGTQDGEGYDPSARIGNKVTLLSQKFDMNFVGENSTFNQLRCLIVESVDGATTLALTDVLQFANYSLHGDLIFVSPYTTKTGTNKRYKIHMDKTFELNGTMNGGRITKQIHHKVKFGKTGKVINFNGNAAQPVDHKMHLFVISDSTVVNHPSIKYNCRSSFIDS